MIGCGWFLDSGASFHMTCDKSLFNTLEEKDLNILIEVGDDERYSVSRVLVYIFGISPLPVGLENTLIESL